ncbi:Holliday junction branch migration protein RuvA [Amaricoccus sp.]|uniref:Holliday junction branch migration protein RuvA n=1 Tax=Amaricoccus sp. TaxID=1872485 RepID=UPI001B492A56|nr:Holliday junction branch migration protein RuvA [Amaricoccus sp.]MBP7242307.1 Holliday junction branch migration protein RuvA [Amaricoccus sp.]
MIGKLTGRLDYRALDHVLIDVGGVGYLVYCSDRTLARMPPPGGPVALYTELLVREDLLQLFGFLTLAEREWHRLLVSVQGVGAKAALSVLGALGADGLSRALALGDAAAIKAAPGVGPKLAQRIVLELKAKSPGVIALGAAGARAPSTPAPEPGAPALVAPPAPDEASAVATAEALSALVNLGYAPGEAAAAVAEVAAEGPTETPTLIRAALKRLAPKA